MLDCHFSTLCSWFCFVLFVCTLPDPSESCMLNELAVHVSAVDVETASAGWLTTLTI